MPGWFKLGNPVTAEWRGRPAQMLKEDAPIWWKYLDSPNTPTYEEIYYNVAMTTVEPEDVSEAENLRDMWLYNISKRVDVIGILPGEAHIIEVTTRAGVRALGQAMLYQFLYSHTAPMDLPGLAMIVCEYSDPDVNVLAQLLGIRIVELTPLTLQHIVSQVFPK